MTEYPEKPDLEGYTARQAWEAGYDAGYDAARKNIRQILEDKDDDDYGEGFWL